MAYQIPELANAAGLRWVDNKYTLYTRDKYKEFPTPLALCGAWHTVRIDIYRDQIKTTPTTDLGKHVEAVDLHHLHQVNVLSMATPRVEDLKVEYQQALPVVCDLFNTFVAGFTLAYEQAAKGSPVQINSGPIGTGDFNNNIHLVYILQVLAASAAAAKLHLDPARLVLYGYAGSPKLEQVAKDSEDLLQQIDNKFKAATKTLTVLEWISKQLVIPPNPPPKS